MCVHFCPSGSDRGSLGEGQIFSRLLHNPVFAHTHAHFGHPRSCRLLVVFSSVLQPPQSRSFSLSLSLSLCSSLTPFGACARAIEKVWYWEEGRGGGCSFVSCKERVCVLWVVSGGGGLLLWTTLPPSFLCVLLPIPTFELRGRPLLLGS